MTKWTRKLRRLFFASAVFLGAAAPGCGDGLWSSGGAYNTGMAERPTPEVYRSVNATRKDERQAALRIVANRAGEARRQGRPESARELEEVIIRRYFVEKEQEVRACIVRLCAPAVGRGSSGMVRFLRDRIAAGEFPGFAALSLASLAPKNAVLDIEPLTRHPAPEVRLQAATALSVLGDPRGYDAVARVWRGMRDSVWPDPLDGVPLAEARASLEARAERGFGTRLK